MTRRVLFRRGWLTVVVSAITLSGLGTEVSATAVGSRVLVPASRQAAPTATAPASPPAEPEAALDGTEALVPDVRAEAAIAYDPVTGQVLWEENSQTRRSIASITKVMTAVVFLEDAPDLSEQVVVQRADVRRASTTYLRAGYKLTTGDLLHFLLIGSDNAAARVLARVSRHGSAGFIERMNQKAAELGLASTRYADPSGLLSDNVSSAYDMARLIAIASADERIGSVMQKPRHSVVIGRRTVNVKSTNHLVTTGDVDVLGGKTGFIRRAGYRFAALLRLPQSGQQVAVVVLGAKSSAVRFSEVRRVFNWLASQAEGLISAPLEAATASS